MIFKKHHPNKLSINENNQKLKVENSIEQRLFAMAGFGVNFVV